MKPDLELTTTHLTDEQIALAHGMAAIVQLYILADRRFPRITAGVATGLLVAWVIKSRQANHA